MPRHTAEANKMRRDLEELREAVSRAARRQLTWDATEAKTIDLIIEAIDRKVALQQRLADADDDKAAVKLASEVRLTEAHIARLLQVVKPKPPKATGAGTSRASQRGQRAANVRWGNAS